MTNEEERAHCVLAAKDTGCSEYAESISDVIMRERAAAREDLEPECQAAALAASQASFEEGTRHGAARMKAAILAELRFTTLPPPWSMEIKRLIDIIAVLP